MHVREPDVTGQTHAVHSRPGSRTVSDRDAAGGCGPLRGAKRAVWARAWLLGAWLASRRRACISADELRSHDHRAQTRGMGLRMTEFLRNRLRPAWLRMRRAEDEGA